MTAAAAADEGGDFNIHCAFKSVSLLMLCFLLQNSDA
jgi:hypothetical protein